MGRKDARREAGVIAAPKFETVAIRVVGTAPYVQHKFSAKMKKKMREKQEAGSVATKNKKREPKDFQELYREALHVCSAGGRPWHGIPAAAFRNAMISACRAAGFVMTRAKLSVFVEADGFDDEDLSPLVQIDKGEPEYFETMTRNETGVADLRPRPLWKPGWEAVVRVRYDAAQFSEVDVKNLMVRAGAQVGIGEGRPDSRRSCGQGWGLFEIAA